MNKKIYIITIVIILMVAILSRCWGWPYAISDVNCDEAMSAINAKAIAETGKDIYGTSYPVYFESWVYGGQSAFAIYIIALFIKIFGFSIVSVRLPILLFSIAGICFAILIVNKIFKNRTMNLIVGILLAINPWHILQSQWVLDCNFFPHVFVIATYFLLIGIEDKKNVFLYISMIIYAVALYTYGIALYLIPIFLLIMAIYLLRKHKITIKKLLICIAIFLVIAIPIILMTIINLFDMPTINIGKLTIQNFEYLTRSNDMLLFAENKALMLLVNIQSLLKIIFLGNDGLIWNSFPIFGTIYYFSLPIIIFAIVYICLKIKDNNIDLTERTKTGIAILFAWIIIGVVCGIIINGININRINIIWYILVIWNAIGIYQIAKVVKYKKVFNTFIIFFYLLNFIGFIGYFYSNGAEQIINSGTWSQGLVDAIEYVYELNCDRIILSNNVVNSDKKDIFIRYATKLEQNKELMEQEEFLKYYQSKEETAVNFSTKSKEFSIKQIEKDTKLTEEVYVITKKEYEEMNNLSRYKEIICNKYIVLIKEIER